MKIKNPLTVSYHFFIPVTKDAREQFKQETLVLLAVLVIGGDVINRTATNRCKPITCVI